MVDNVVGMIVGAAIDCSDGDSGIKGAAIGAVVESTVRVAIPLIVTFAIGWAVQYGVRQALSAIGGDDTY